MWYYADVTTIAASYFAKKTMWNTDVVPGMNAYL